LEFNAVYREFSPVVARWAARLGGPEVSVEDTVQDIFLVVSRRLSTFRGDAKLSTWLFGITLRTIGNWRRRRRWSKWFVRLTKQIENTAPALGLTPVENVERREGIARSYRILDAMPEKLRTTLLLFEAEGLPTHEIAKLLDVELATVRVRLHRGRREFLRRLSALEEQGGAT
jgi:RNA polymerase sigma-70 factor (ECF subfamily)